MVKYLASYFALELYTRTIVDETQVLEHSYPLFIVWQKLQVLVRHELPERKNVLLDHPLIVLHLEMF
jgi:hypothetical protein